MRFEPKDRLALQRAALGKQPSDLAVENVQYVNVFTGEIYPATVYVLDGFVAFVDHENPKADTALAKRVVNGGGRYLLPGFIDAHVHIESTLMTPPGFAEISLPHGTTTVITDPHEIGNVLGEAGVEYMVQASEGLPQRQLIDIPSCVPAIPAVESAGAAFDADTVRRLAKLPRVAGLAEVMDFVGVANGDERMRSIIAAAEECGLYLQGHVCTGDPRLLAAYRIGGPITCHETQLEGDVLAKVRSGISLDMREASDCHNVATLWKALAGTDSVENLGLCTDDRHCEDVVDIGHMDNAVRIAVAAGMPVVEAIRCATIRNARRANLQGIGAVAPGYAADFLLTDDLDTMQVAEVWYAGELVAKDGKMLSPIPYSSYPAEKINSMNVPALTADDLLLHCNAPDGEVAVTVLDFPGIAEALSVAKVEKLPVKNGVVQIEQDPDLCYCAVINRYGSGGYTVGVVRGSGVMNGADASTVSHDSHNLTLVYRDAKAAHRCYELLRDCGGGLCYVNGESETLLPLPVGGVMTTERAERVREMCAEMRAAMHAAGMPQENPLLRITCFALPCIPDVKQTDRGLADTLTQQFIPLFPEA